MNGRKAHKKSGNKEKILSRVLMLLAAVVLFCGLMLQINLRSQINDQSKELEKVMTDINLLMANAENLNRCINDGYDDVELEQQARRLGMDYPAEGQLRVISLHMPNGNTAAQTVSNVNGEEISG